MLSVNVYIYIYIYIYIYGICIYIYIHVYIYTLTLNIDNWQSKSIIYIYTLTLNIDNWQSKSIAIHHVKFRINFEPFSLSLSLYIYTLVQRRCNQPKLGVSTLESNRGMNISGSCGEFFSALQIDHDAAFPDLSHKHAEKMGSHWNCHCHKFSGSTQHTGLITFFIYEHICFHYHCLIGAIRLDPDL